MHDEDALQYRTRSNYPNILIAQMATFIILPSLLNMLDLEFTYTLSFNRMATPRDAHNYK